MMLTCGVAEVNFVVETVFVVVFAAVVVVFDIAEVVVVAAKRFRVACRKSASNPCQSSRRHCPSS